MFRFTKPTDKEEELEEEEKSGNNEVSQIFPVRSNLEKKMLERKD